MPTHMTFCCEGFDPEAHPRRPVLGVPSHLYRQCLPGKHLAVPHKALDHELSQTGRENPIDGLGRGKADVFLDIGAVDKGGV